MSANLVMARFVLWRVVSGAVLIFAMATLTFAMMSLTGTNVARSILGPLATPQEAAIKKSDLGLNQSWLTQYKHWLWAAIHGNFGKSWFSGVSVGASLRNELPITLSIAVAALILTAVISVGLGVASAVGPRWLDRGVQIVAVGGFAIPSFVVGIALALVIGVDLHWLPATGYVEMNQSVTGWLRSIILPTCALAIGSIAAAAQQVRGSMIDVLRTDYIRTLRSRGVSRFSLLFKHALKNAGPPALTVLSLQFVGLLSGTVVIEKVFGLSGIGTEAYTASVEGDRPMVMGVIVYVVAMIAIVNLLIDITYGSLNPKVRAA